LRGPIAGRQGAARFSADQRRFGRITELDRNDISWTGSSDLVRLQPYSGKIRDFRGDWQEAVIQIHEVIHPAGRLNEKGEAMSDRLRRRTWAANRQRAGLPSEARR
jgi:hypothetical protein